jgi:hypothetical protein
MTSLIRTQRVANTGRRLTQRNLRRLPVLLALVASMATVGLATPGVAAADYASLHRHGWSSGLLWRGTAYCTDRQDFYGTISSGSIGFEPPDIMTTPVRQGQTSEVVYFRAVLEWWDGSKFVEKYWNGSQYVYYKSTGWYWGKANTTALMAFPNWLVWAEYPSNRYLGVGRIGWDVSSGFHYRVHLYYHWGVDGATADDVTNWCTVN